MQNKLTIQLDEKASAQDLLILAVSAGDTQPLMFDQENTQRKQQLSNLLAEGLISGKKGSSYLLPRANKNHPN
jgi:hypothetical protein